MSRNRSERGRALFRRELRAAPQSDHCQDQTQDGQSKQRPTPGMPGKDQSQAAEDDESHTHYGDDPLPLGHLHASTMVNWTDHGLFPRTRAARLTRSNPVHRLLERKLQLHDAPTKGFILLPEQSESR